MKALYISAIALMAGLQVSTAQAGDDNTPYWVDTPVIEAIGRAQIETRPNLTNFTVRYEVFEPTSNAAMQGASQRAKAAYKDMKRVGGDAVTISSSFSIQTIYHQYKNESGYMMNYNTPDKIKGYNAQVTLEIELDDISRLGEVRAAAFAHGPDYTGYVNTSLVETPEMKAAAFRAAFSDARNRAQATAGATGVKLGKMLVAQSGQGPCLGTLEAASGKSGAVTGYYDKVSRSVMAAPPPPPPPPPPPSPSGGGTAISQQQLDALNLPMDTRKTYINATACVVYAIAPQ